MKSDTNPVEYSEESILNLFILVKALGELLLDREYIDTASLERRMQKEYSVQANHIFLAIPMSCPNCGRQGFDGIGDDTKCLFCGKELRFNVKDEQADEILAPLDAFKLFGFAIKAADMTNDADFISVAAKSFTVPYVYYAEKKDGNRMIVIDKQRKTRNADVTFAHDKVASHQQQINRLCQMMLAIWELLPVKNPETGSRILMEFLTIDEDKKQHAYDALYTPAICEKCHNEQWPDSLFHARCSDCAEPLPVRLLPGLLVMQASAGNPLSQASAKERKIEYLYTLFEALYHCAQTAFGLTLDDLTKEITEKAVQPDTEDGQLVCPSCQHHVSQSVFLRGLCPYCGKISSGLFMDRFF